MMTEEFDDWDLPQEEDDLPPSKSQLKRDAHALQAIGEKLVSMSADQLKKLDLPDDLREAVMLARRINARSSGRKRQLQYIGKLMRNIDAEPIIDQVNRLEQTHIYAAKEFHQMEQWRERMIAEGDAALGEFMQLYPDLDRQRFRQLVRQAQTAKPDQKKFSRELFKEIRSVMGDGNDTGRDNEIE